MKDFKIIEIMELFDEDEITTADKIDRPERALEKEAFDDFNKRNPMAGGGMLVQPGFGGTRQGYRSDKAIKAAQQAGNVAKQKARFDKIGKAFIQQDYNALKTLTRPARIAAGAKDAGGILNQADTLLLNNVIFGNDVKAQNELAKKLGINRKYMIDTYKEAIKFTKEGKSKKISELRLKKLEIQKNLFDEILENPNATVKSMAKKFNKTEKEIVKQSSLLLKNVYDQNVVIGKGEFRDRPLKSWLPDDFNTTDNFLDNFSNIKGLRKVQQENIGTLIRDAFGKGQNPKKYTQALTALSEYNKLVNSLPEGLKLNLDHPLSKAFLKGSNVPPEKLLFVTPISSDYNRGFKAKLDTAYKNALLNPNKDKKLIKTIENFADTIGVNIGKGSTKKFDFGTANIAKKTQADFADEIAQNLREQNLARKNLLKFQKTKEGKDVIKQIFPKAQKLEIPEVPEVKAIEKLLASFSANPKCRVTFSKKDGGRINYANGPASLADCADSGKKRLEKVIKTGVKLGPQEGALATQILKAGRSLGSAFTLSGLFGPAALAFTAAAEAGFVGYDMLTTGKTFKETIGDSLLNYALGEKTKIDPQKELFKRFSGLGYNDEQIGKFANVLNQTNTLNTILKQDLKVGNLKDQVKAFREQPKDQFMSPDDDMLQTDTAIRAEQKLEDEQKNLENLLINYRSQPPVGLNMEDTILGDMASGKFQETQQDLQAANIFADIEKEKTAANRLAGLEGAISEQARADRIAGLEKDYLNLLQERGPQLTPFAGGGIAKLAGIDEGPQTVSMNPNSQGLSGLLKRGKKI